MKMKESRRHVAGRVSAAAICSMLLGACGSATSSPGAGPSATGPLVSGSAAPITTAPGTTGTVTTAPETTGTPSNVPVTSPAAAASGRRCQPGQLRATFIPLGAATGHVGAEIVFRNASASPCHLSGYPGLKMLNSRGGALPTTVARGGSFLFPAVTPHLVGIAPGQKASFDLEYGDNPTGNPPPPYQKACPMAAALEIIPPADFTAVRATAKLAPCNGDLIVSPVVAGTAPIRFS